MKFCWSTLKVKNLEESIRFYTEVIGLKVVNRINAGPGMEIAFLGEGYTKIELICENQNKDIEIGGDISWGFEVDSIDKMISLLKEKGIKIESGPIQPNPHVKFLFIKDPDNMNIQLVEII